MSHYRISFSFLEAVFCHLVNGDESFSEVADVAKDIFCYACGLPEIDPNLDEPGSFGDARREWTPAGKKMYNSTCDIASQMGFDDKWLRQCPHGVKSCFWSKTTYDGKVGIFRGCAPSFFPMDEGCRIELESVLVGSLGSTRVAPRVELCFCNKDKCNIGNVIEDYLSQGSMTLKVQSWFALYLCILFGLFISYGK